MHNRPTPRLTPCLAAAHMARKHRRAAARAQQTPSPAAKGGDLTPASRGEDAGRRRHFGEVITTATPPAHTRRAVQDQALDALFQPDRVRAVQIDVLLNPLLRAPNSFIGGFLPVRRLHDWLERLLRWSAWRVAAASSLWRSP